MMDETTQTRLQEFRSDYKRANGRNSVWAVLQFVVLLSGITAILVLVALMHTHMKNGKGTVQVGLSPDKQREYAVYLEGKNLAPEAIKAYETYLETTLLPPDVRATVCYSIAKLAIDTENYEKALAYLYQSEFLSPESELKDEINKKVVMCLDKLARPVDLRHELRKRSAPTRTAADLEEGEVILAEVGGEIITDRDLEEEIAKLPASVRDAVSAQDKKVEFLKSLVAQRALVDKARRLELDKSPEIQEELTKQLDALIVNKLIEDEVGKRLQITPEDVKRFYEAEPERFTEPAQAQVRIAKADSEAAAKEAIFDQEAVTVREGGAIPGAGANDAAMSAIFAAEPNTVTAPMEINGAWYVFKLESKTSAKKHSYEEVAQQAERMYRQQKEQELIQALLDETLKGQDVQFHPERLQQEAAPSS